MNKDILQIRWDTGNMTINMDVFFPTSTQKMKKLWKLICMDWKHRDDLVIQLSSYLEQQIEELKIIRKQFPETPTDKNQIKSVKNLQKTDEKLKRNLDFLKKVGEK